MQPDTPPAIEIDVAEVAAIVAKLSKAQREALAHLSAEEWKAGPSLSTRNANQIKSLREAGLVQRNFGDLGSPTAFDGKAGLSIHLSACWWFRLTPLGLRARAHLERNPDAE